MVSARPSGSTASDYEHSSAPRAPNAQRVVDIIVVMSFQVKCTCERSAHVRWEPSCAGYVRARLNVGLHAGPLVDAAWVIHHPHHLYHVDTGILTSKSGCAAAKLPRTFLCLMGNRTKRFLFSSRIGSTSFSPLYSLICIPDAIERVS